MESDTDGRVTQETFAGLVGISQARVAQMVADGVLQRDGTCRQWLLAYCERLREQAAGRDRELTIERAALAREQRRGQSIKNRVAEGEFASIALLSDVLAMASRAVAQQLDSLGPTLRRVCPEMTEAQRAAVLTVVARCRNEWSRATARLVATAVETVPDEDDDLAQPADPVTG